MFLLLKNKKLLIAFTILYAVTTEPKFINLFKKEKVTITFQQEDNQAKELQAKTNKFLLNNTQELFYPKEQPIKTNGELAPLEEDSSVDPIELSILNNQIPITTGEIFELFSELLKIAQEKIFEHEQAEIFFTKYGPTLLSKISDLQNKSWKNKKNREQLSILTSYYICAEYDKDASNIDLFIKKMGSFIQEPFGYIYVEKMIQNQIKTLRNNKELKKLCSNSNITLLKKQLKIIKQWILQQPNYMYEKKMAEKQTTFSTNFLPNRYNQLPFIDRTTLKYLNTDSAKPQHEIYYDVQYS